MSVENFFVVKVLLFALCFGSCLLFWLVFLVLLARVFGCGSAWFVVRMNVVKREVSLCCESSAGRGISKEEGVMPLIPSSTNVAGRFEQLSMNTQAQSV